ncbi:hypothetical protein SYNTR_0423 [Candidatus Syntrophocurvum alkaliphilum]|uniref:Uncharacterized protein n=1 Tax=Candidatus Syntrophocurvum alkaliphilum TaxID=2293317 RepID=A0A6I6D771_9FIRM|nr:hypothetical protein [Candidatus Syntrophocurvum alkaliphilum]QGT99016.1 hypothetical protein SYNTR_0423 [Candidatus Syntrophocurvum alkaliphilum]
MTELQQLFLFYTIIYFVIKGAIFVCIYIATIIIEKHAREKRKLLQEYLNKKRTKEEERWKVAYSLYDKKQKQSTA